MTMNAPYCNRFRLVKNSVRAKRSDPLARCVTRILSGLQPLNDGGYNGKLDFFTRHLLVAPIQECGHSEPRAQRLEQQPSITFPPRPATRLLARIGYRSLSVSNRSVDGSPSADGHNSGNAWRLKMLSRSLQTGWNRVLFAFGLLILSTSLSYPAQVVLLRGGSLHPIEEEQTRRIAAFYGLTLKVVNVGLNLGIEHAVSALRTPELLAVLATPDVTSPDTIEKLLKPRRLDGERSIPLLVYGIAPARTGSKFKLRSTTGPQTCTPFVNDFRPTVLEVHRAGEVTGSLGGINLPAVASPACQMQFQSGRQPEIVLSARGHGRTAAVLVRSHTKTADIFFVPEMRAFDTSWIVNPRGLPGAFSSMAPLLLFLGWAAGDRAWHLEGRYANLTIDDPWLRQPYGHLDYLALLHEMEKHNFHTTIAFIPWNFDRNEPDVVDLLRSHPARFSLCIHGNNHLHREFGGYMSNSFQQQAADIRQAVARMERLQALTGLPYDRIMVFPHAVAPERTFAALKEYNFLATANSLDIPMDATFPDDPLFLLRPFTRIYGDFLSLFRYPTNEIPYLDIAIQSYLGNPILFYGHEDLFETGADAFNGFAEAVNRIAPDTHWAGLKEIARHLYLVRRLNEKEFDIQMLSTEADLTNPAPEDAVFHIHYPASRSSSDPLATIDGTRVTFVRSHSELRLTLSVPPGHVSRVRVAYRNNFAPANEDIRKTSFQRVVRWTSDLRDIYLSRLPWGTAITRAYYRYGGDRIELRVERNRVFFSIALIVALIGFAYLYIKSFALRKQKGAS